MSKEILVAIIFKVCTTAFPGENPDKLICFDALNNCAVGRGGLILMQDEFKRQCVDKLPDLMEKERNR